MQQIISKGLINKEYQEYVKNSKFPSIAAKAALGKEQVVCFVALQDVHVKLEEIILRNVMLLFTC